MTPNSIQLLLKKQIPPGASENKRRLFFAYAEDMYQNISGT